MPAFLFTDLESSTRLWEEHPDDMRPALARHDTILRGAIGEAGGDVVKSTGDGMLAVFDSAVSAVTAAIAAQQRLQGEEWPTGSPLRVRMGVHLGEGEHRDGDYYGPAVNRAARIMAAGHGDEVLLSGAVVEMAGSSTPRGATFEDLGVHRLKDLTLPEHLYRLVHEGLRVDFPPPATLEAAPHNLPLQATEFFGRGDELASIRLMLESPGTRLVTLTGPGGAGKTRLALQVAAELVGRFPDGAFFVDLSPETDPMAAYEAILRAIDVASAPSRSPLESLESGLRDREVLLVLDNFEQVTAAATGVADLVQRCPRLKVLVTSREALRIRAERVFPVPALSVPHPAAALDVIAESEAVRLFVDRARSVRPAFTLDETNAEVIAQICLRLDGLPLAIELAAARLNVFAPAELMSRLRNRLDVLGAGGRDLPARQRTLWGAIGWSYELLDPVERRLFEMMSVFSTADLDSLEAVAAEALGVPSVLDPLSSLVDKSLVRTDETDVTPRFTMLQTIREFAVERLAESEELDLRIRTAHALHFTEMALRLRLLVRESDRDAVLAEVSSSIGNLRTAWRHWVETTDLDQIVRLIDALWALHDAKGWYHAAIELAREALSILATSDASHIHAGDELTLRTSIARALLAVQGYTGEVEQAFRQVLEASSRQGGSVADRFPVLRALGTYHMSTADFATAAGIGAELLGLGEAEDDDVVRLHGHYLFGAATTFSGDLVSGMPHLERAIELFDPDVHSGGHFVAGPSLGVTSRVALGLTLWQCGALERAVDRVAEALDLARRLRHPYSLAYALYHSGLLHVYRRKFETTIERAHELADVAAEHDYRVWATLATVLEGLSHTGLGDVRRGLELTEAGVELYRGLTTPPVFWPLILGLRGLVFARAGEPERGLALVEEAVGLVGTEGTGAPDLLILHGDTLSMLERFDLGEDQYQSAARASRAMGLRLVELQAVTRIAQSRRHRSLTPDGADEVRNVLETFTEGRGEFDVIEAIALVGDQFGP